MDDLLMLDDRKKEKGGEKKLTPTIQRGGGGRGKSAFNNHTLGRLTCRDLQYPAKKKENRRKKILESIQLPGGRERF